ncbi:DMT family transporter [Cellulomonas fimi]|uniref:EamA family transporter n=1 Tax=Cellulomonas fimi TaxID=1708 RepID=A0A7Y0M285_CELFI|nr:EamA family transporter [Cellulomonas fimi]NMR21127.1 EamA family transporter [Cellulomonas fimi]
MTSAPGRPPDVPARDRVPAPALFLLSGLTLYLGAAIAVDLFPVLGAPTVAWLRIVVAAVVLVAWRRPWRSRWSRRDLLAVAGFGTVLAAMNVTFYVAIDHLPLGTAVAMEFLGPIAVATLTGRGWRERVGIALAAVGVVLLAGVTLDAGGGPDVVVGLVAVLAAAACWAAYILLGRRVALGESGVTSLSLAMVAGGLVFAPFLVGSAGPVVTDGRVALAVLAVALLSSVVPYVIDQVVLRRVSSATFALLQAMLPATAAVIGALVLRQLPTPLEVLGLVAVSGAIALTSFTRGTPAPAPVADPG